MVYRQRLIEIAEQLIGKVSDQLYLVLRFRRRLGRWPRIRPPQTFNEHLLRYKLRSRGDFRLPRLADKVLVKQHIAAAVGEAHVVPTLWSGAALPAHDQRTWPVPYVIKSNHACGQLIFVHSETALDWEEIRKTTDEWLSSDYAPGRRDKEWHYAQIKPQLLIEPLLGDGEHAPADYKFYVFHGTVHFITVDEGRFEDHCRYTFDREWRPMPFEAGEKRGPVDPGAPPELSQMIALAETLGAEFEFVRVDMYDVAGQLLVGELTFFPGGGHVRWSPPEGDEILGRFWN